MSDDKRDEKLGMALYGVAYFLFALKFIGIATLIGLGILWLLDKPLWIAPIAAVALFLIYRFFRRLVVGALVRWGRKSSGVDK